MVASHKPDGSVCPQAVILSDGRRYDIDKYLDPRATKSIEAGQPVMAYAVWSKEERTYLFEAGGRWWVLMKQ